MTRLAVHERKLAMALNPSDRAKRLAPTLHELAREMQPPGNNPSISDELTELFVERLTQAADLLHILDAEVFRLRQSIGCFDQGHMDRARLRKVSKTWNGDTS